MGAEREQGRGTGNEQDWRDQGGPHGEPVHPEDRQAVPAGEPDIGTAGAFPGLANDRLPDDPDVPTEVDDPQAPTGTDGDESAG